MKNMLKWLSLGLVCCLSACTPTAPKYSTASQDIQQILQSGAQSDQGIMHQNAAPSKSISGALLPPLTLQSQVTTPVAEHRFDISVKDMPAKDFFMGLVSGTQYNMLVGPEIVGNITLHLKNVTIQEALDNVRDLYGYDYKKISDGFEILPAKMTTQIFSVNYLNVRRTGQSQTQLISTDLTSTSSASNGSTQGSSNGSSGGSSVTGSGSIVLTKSEDDFWGNLKITLQTLVGNEGGRWFVLNPQASVVVVHALPHELHEVSQYLDVIQNHLARQVVIEAKILEVQLSDQYQAGIDWKALTASQNGATSSRDLDSGFDGGIFSLSLSAFHHNFTSVIDLLEQQGNIQVLSSPHISTVNNQEAVIKVGDDEYFVTGYTSNVTPSSGESTTSQSVQLNPFFSGITLDVTPEIGDNNEVTLYIHPSISDVRDESKTIQTSGSGGTTSNLTLPLAHSTIRESDNVVRARSGQIIVIGGLMENLTKEQIAATPWLSKIPFAGALARNTNQQSTKVELVILLRPEVIGDDGWSDNLQAKANDFAKLERGFHLGSRPEIFGTEAEANP